MVLCNPSDHSCERRCYFNSQCISENFEPWSAAEREGNLAMAMKTDRIGIGKSSCILSGRQGRKVQCRPRPTPSARFPQSTRTGAAIGRVDADAFYCSDPGETREKRQGVERPQKLQEATRAIFSTSFPLFKLMPCRLFGVEESKNQIRDQRGESDANAKSVLMMFMIVPCIRNGQAGD